MLGKYDNVRTGIAKRLNELSKLLAQQDRNNTQLEMLQERMERLNQDVFNLVVIGQYKRGKTTFINALLGANILPMAIVPLTSIVTIIQYGKEIQGKVEFINGETRRIDIEDLATYITETENPGNSKHVKIVEINYPSDYLKEGIRLIDTPGIGSVHQHNTDVTYSFLPKIDAAIFVLSVDPPISREECQFLKDVIPYVPKIFFVQNKIDIVTESDRKQSQMFSKKMIEQLTELRDITIYPLSAKQALDGMVQKQYYLINASRIIEFKNVLGDFFIRESQETLLRTTALLTKNLIYEAILNIDIEYSTMDLPVAQIKENLLCLTERFKKVKQEKMDIAYLLKGELERFNWKLEVDLEEFKDKATRELKIQLQELCLREQALKPTELAVELNSLLAKSIVTQFQRWQPGKEQEANEWLASTIKRFEANNNMLMEEIKRLVADLFQIEFHAVASTITLSSKSALYFVTEENKPLFTLPSGLMMRLLPKSWVKRLLLESSKEQAARLVRVNCARVRYDVYCRMAKSIDTFRRGFETRLDQTMDEILGTIDGAIELKSLGEEAVERRKGELEGIRANLARIKYDIETLVV